MSKVSDNPHGLADNVLELSDKELDAIRQLAREADGRKGHVKLARNVLGVPS